MSAGVQTHRFPPAHPLPCLASPSAQERWGAGPDDSLNLDRDFATIMNMTVGWHLALARCASPLGGAGHVSSCSSSIAPVGTPAALREGVRARSDVIRRRPPPEGAGHAEMVHRLIRAIPTRERSSVLSDLYSALRAGSTALVPGKGVKPEVVWVQTWFAQQHSNDLRSSRARASRP